MEDRHKIKFFYVVFAFTTAIVLISSITISAVIYYRFDMTISKQKENIIHNTTEQLKNNILRLVENSETIANNIYGNFTMQTLLDGYHFSKIDYDMLDKFNSVTSNLRSITSNNKVISSISIYSLDDGLISNGKEIRRIRQFGQEKLIQKTIDARGIDVWDTYRDEITGENQIILMKYLNIYSPGGILVIEMNEQRFNDLYRPGSANNYFFLMDDSNRVLSSNVRETVGYEITKEIKQFVQEGTGIGTLMYNNTRYYSYSEQVNKSWSLVVLYDSNEIEKEKRNITYYVIYITVFLILVFTLLGLLFSKWSAQQVIKLVRKIKEVDRGNLDIKPSIGQINEFYLLDQALCKMAHNIVYLQDDILKVQKQREESEIKYLQMQMNPHFLYNLLSVIRWIAHRNKQEQIEVIIDHLSDFYRMALSKGNDIISIQDEIKLVKSYTELQNISLGDMIELSVHLDECLSDLEVCKMTLQPFVENSIIHGFVHGQELHISIDIIEWGKAGVRICIADNGCGITDESIGLIESLNELNVVTSGASYGITNTIARLKYMFGDNVFIHVIRSSPGTLIEIIIKNAD